MNYNILIADDDFVSLELLKSILEPEYNVEAVDNGIAALEHTVSALPDLILLDVKMPKMSGYEVCRILSKDPLTAGIPVIFVSGFGNSEDESKGFKAGGVDYIVKPLRPSVVSHRVHNHLMLANQKNVCNEEVRRKTQQLREATIEQIMAIMRAAQFKEHETAKHTLRTGLMAWMIAMDLGMSKQWSQQIFLSAPMHDIGKIGVPDEILLSPLNLRKDKPKWWMIMQKHTIYGRDIIGENLHTDIMKMASNIAVGHHEKMDGSGYPFGIKGDDIPLEARLTSVVDMIDAMMDTTRTYRDSAIPDDKIQQILTQEKGVLLDENVVSSALNNWNLIKDIHHSFSDEIVPLENYVYLSADELATTLEKNLNITTRKQEE